MLRNTFIAFICGWVVWFLIEKPSTGLERFLQTGDGFLVNFQHAFDLLKSGYFVQSYVFIWNAHYIILSIIFGMLMSIIYGVLSNYLARRRRREQIVKSSLKKEICDSIDESENEK
ncbi:MAG: hypothetical protein OQL19_03855 [Gammaproteobacteria bacterium]|nr:hypothetical protein [Gammaproteobacteria bacterium]